MGGMMAGGYPGPMWDWPGSRTNSAAKPRPARSKVPFVPLRQHGAGPSIAARCIIAVLASIGAWSVLATMVWKLVILP